MSSARDQEYMGDGLAEEILNLLAQVDGLQVVGRTSSFSFKGKATRIEEIGRDLHVAHVLEGSVRRAGQRIRVTAQLVKTADGFHLWSQNFDRDLADALALQDEIARAVVAAIAPRLTGRAPAAPRPGAAPPPDAYAAYLAGKQGSRATDQARLRQAQASLERAVELAPGFAPAHAALARTYNREAGYFAESPEEVSRFARLELASAERALALDPALGEAYAARADHALSYAFDWKQALADAQRAVALAPSAPEARSVLAAALSTVGRSAEALAEARRAVAADPLADWTWASLGLLALRTGDRATVAEALERLAVIAPSSPLHLTLRASALFAGGRIEEARAAYRQVPLEFMQALGAAVCEHRLGHEAASREALAVLEGRLAGAAAYQAAEAHAMRGEAEQAFAWLERARVQHDAGLPLLLNDPFLVPLHGDPRWKPFLRLLGLPG
jgi:TolB-like protein